MKILIELGEPDLVIAAESLGAYHEYLKAIMRGVEKSPRGHEIDETIRLLSRANAVERARQALVRYKECVTIEAANDQTMEVEK